MWIGAVKWVLFFNSMGCWPSRTDTEAVQLLMEATQPHLKWTSWRLVVPETPQQTDTCSCRYRVCWLALAAATGSTTPYSSDVEENVIARIQVQIQIDRHISYASVY